MNPAARLPKPYMKPVTLKPQDVAVLLKLLVWENQTRDETGSVTPQSWTLARLASEVYLSVSEVHYVLNQATTARLIRGSEGVLNRHNLEEFLLHGVAYAFPAAQGGSVRGLPTYYGAPPLRDFFIAGDAELPVWPYADGTVRGASFSPLYSGAPQAAMEDAAFYELLALVDVFRGHARTRERAVATEILKERISGSQS